MASLAEKILVELENIDKLFIEMPPHIKLPYLSTLELAGVAALLHNFYNGIENILKQIFIAQDIPLPEGHSWHKELIEISVKEKIITEKCKNLLGQYLAFRHFFSHAYALDLYPYKLEPLVENSQNLYTLFKKEISTFL
ncbi:MAG: hypothetical protein K9I71_12305 [Ignavibacteriales bacterium]|nr:hypothetical protein [Ignavibacteriales bacterium]MCF8438532.1 hypothetical protein [Ignavibacteriales bacterium]